MKSRKIFTRRHQGAFLAMITLIFMFVAVAPQRASAQQKASKDSLSAEIRSLLEGHQLWLNYPLSTKRFYKQQDYEPQWLTASREDNTWKCMLLLDCVLHFGLSYNDYRYNEHLPSTLHDVLEKPDRVSLTMQARFEIMLTDDMITFLNQLHFGVLNPSFTPGIIDSAESSFRAEDILADALKQKKFLAVLSAVQPKCKEYERLEEYLSSSLLYGEDCYELPEGDLQNVAMNMERLRWAAIEEDRYMLVNIPAFSLKYYRTDSVSEFNIVVGSPATPTPQLQSAIKSLTTGPDYKVPGSVFLKQVLPGALKEGSYLSKNQLTIYDLNGAFVNVDHKRLTAISGNPAGYYAMRSASCDNASGSIVFSFPNIYELSMHDTPDETVFGRERRALSNGGIVVENADSLAVLLLKDNGAQSKVKELQEAMFAYKRKTFKLQKAVPIKVVYLTSAIINGKLVSYPDVYELDKSLQSVMFPAARPFSMR